MWRMIVIPRNESYLLFGHNCILISLVGNCRDSEFSVELSDLRIDLGIPRGQDSPQKKRPSSKTRSTRVRPTKKETKQKAKKKGFFFCCGAAPDVNVDLTDKPEKKLTKEMKLMNQLLQVLQDAMEQHSSVDSENHWVTFAQCQSSILSNPLLKSAFLSERIQLFRPDDRDNVPHNGIFLDLPARLKHARQITELPSSFKKTLVKSPSMKKQRNVSSKK